MTWVVTEPTLGSQPIAATSTTKKHHRGRIVQAVDDFSGEAGEFIYLLGCANTEVGSWVTYESDEGQTALLAPNAIAPVAVSMSANPAASYGWYQISGVAVAKALTGYLFDALVYATSTLGSVDDEVVAGDRVKNARSSSSVGTDGLAEFEIQRPWVDDGTSA